MYSCIWNDAYGEKKHGRGRNQQPIGRWWESLIIGFYLLFKPRHQLMIEIFLESYAKQGRDSQKQCPQKSDQCCSRFICLIVGYTNTVRGNASIATCVARSLQLSEFCRQAVNIA
jgi:hypothetical protein